MRTALLNLIKLARQELRTEEVETFLQHVGLEWEHDVDYGCQWDKPYEYLTWTKKEISKTPTPVEQFLEGAKYLSCIHGSKLLRYYNPHLQGCADLKHELMKLIESGKVKPLALDVAGADESVRTFYNIIYNGAKPPSDKINTDTCLMWTYTIGE